jgi:branched-chain amino acid transport system ATP-binding protein
MPDAATALELTNVGKAFGGLLAVDGVTLSVRAGERRAIIGPNGAGTAAHRRARLGLSRTYQITNLFPRLSALDNCVLAVQALLPTKLHLHRSLARYRDQFARARTVLDSVGLGGKEQEEVRNLSHGEQRQLEIALALAGSPRLLLLDEPTAGLSPAESQLMVALLKRLDPAITILIIEHDMDVAFELTDRITVLHYGRVVADGLAHEVQTNPLVQDIYLGASDPTAW